MPTHEKGLVHMLFYHLVIQYYIVIQAESAPESEYVHPVRVAICIKQNFYFAVSGYLSYFFVNIEFTIRTEDIKRPERVTMSIFQMCVLLLL